MAELCIQRGDVELGRSILEKRIAQGATDFKTLNLYGVALAHNRNFENAATIFRRLRAATKFADMRTKVAFNLGLARFYQDLTLVGDLSVVRSLYIKPGETVIPIDQPEPFRRAIEIWVGMLQDRDKHADIIHTYMGFACQQLGFFEQGLGHIAAALSLNEGFYITHFVMGRLFLDLSLLAVEGNDYALGREVINFFDIETRETNKQDEEGRCVVKAETLLDIAIQSFIDARALSPLSACLYVALCEVYLYAGMPDEAHEALEHAETIAPNALATMEMSLRFHETVRSQPQLIRSLIRRIKAARIGKSSELYQILPSYYFL